MMYELLGAEQAADDVAVLMMSRLPVAGTDGGSGDPVGPIR